MARRAVRDLRHIPTATIIGHQPDLFSGPTITHEVPPRPIGRKAFRQILAWARADTLGDLDEAQ
jgi:hypothetical protein